MQKKAVMERLLFSILGIVIIISACNTGEGSRNDKDSEVSTEIIQNPITAEGEADTSALPRFGFDHKDYDFGVIIQGEKLKHVYTYTNTGGSDLVISNVRTSCGCTVPNWNKKPLPPGESEQIEVIFDSEGKRGTQRKTVTLVANTQPNTVTLSFTAKVVVPDKEK